MNKQNRGKGFQKSKFKQSKSFAKKSSSIPKPKGSSMMDQFKPKMPMAGM